MLVGRAGCSVGVGEGRVGVRGVYCVGRHSRLLCGSGGEGCVLC